MQIAHPCPAAAQTGNIVLVVAEAEAGLESVDLAAFLLDRSAGARRTSSSLALTAVISVVATALIRREDLHLTTGKDAEIEAAGNQTTPTPAPIPVG